MLVSSLCPSGGINPLAQGGTSSLIGLRDLGNPNGANSALRALRYRTVSALGTIDPVRGCFALSAQGAAADRDGAGKISFGGFKNRG